MKTDSLLLIMLVDVSKHKTILWKIIFASFTILILVIIDIYLIIFV